MDVRKYVQINRPQRVSTKTTLCGRLQCLVDLLLNLKSFNLSKRPLLKVYVQRMKRSILK